jgi:hypothetical protein
MISTGPMLCNFSACHRSLLKVIPFLWMVSP